MRIIWRVTVQKSYNRIVFDFAFVENAVNFVRTCMEHGDGIEIGIEGIIEEELEDGAE